ncbi:MAG: hypothetical protein ACE5OO_05000 [Candidatus Bathyarchaeia archaeon]
MQVEKFNCPWCDLQSASPGGVRFHVRNEHPEKLKEFMDEHYPEMSERFRRSKQQTG